MRPAPIPRHDIRIVVVIAVVLVAIGLVLVVAAGTTVDGEIFIPTRVYPTVSNGS